VPSEAIAQRERVLHAVRRHRNAIDHLGLYLLLLVRAEKGVVHKVAVVARNVGGRPDGIQGLQVGLRHEPEGPTTLLSVDRWRAAEDLSAIETVHLTLLWEASIDALKATEPAVRDAPP